jgi:ligand-binding SRPBCC domain-containing protein
MRLSSIQLSHTFVVAAPPETVFKYLAEPTNYVGLSPLVVAVRDIRRVDGVLRYTAVERFRFLRILRYDNIIAVTLVAAGNHLPRAEISGGVHSPAGVRMAYRFSIAPEERGTVVVDTLWLRAPLGLLRFAASRAGAVQLARARILAERLK